jgi:hypothetical protein
MNSASKNYGPIMVHESLPTTTNYLRCLITAVFVEARDSGTGLREYGGETEQELLPKLRRLRTLTVFYAPERLRSCVDKLIGLYDEAALKLNQTFMARTTLSA